MNLTNDFDISAAHALAIRAGGAERREARAKHETATAALASARQVRQDAQAEVERLAGEERNWVERHSRKLSAWIAGGSHGTRPVVAADARATLTIASARANLSAAEVAVPQFEAAERAAAQALEAAEGCVLELKLADRRTFMDELIARRSRLEAEILEIRQLASATLAARIHVGASSAFVGVLTPLQTAQLNTPPPWLDFMALHDARRAVVDIHTPISAASEPLRDCLDFLMRRDAALEAIAEGGQILQEVAAA